MALIIIFFEKSISIFFNSDSMYFEGTAKISTSLFSQTLFISDEMLSFLIFKFTELR